MIDYLAEFNISIEEITSLKKSLHEELILNLDIMQNNVKEILKLLLEFGITKPYGVIKYRPDLLFENKHNLEQKLTSKEKEILLFVIDNDIDDLINFGI